MMILNPCTIEYEFKCAREVALTFFIFASHFLILAWFAGGLDLHHKTSTDLPWNDPSLKQQPSICKQTHGLDLGSEHALPAKHPVENKRVFHGLILKTTGLDPENYCLGSTLCNPPGNTGV